MSKRFKNFDGTVILHALKGLGHALGKGNAIEFVIVGGAAGLLAAVLPGSITTSDVDAIHFDPPANLEEILRAAELVADQQGLPKGWLNTEAGLFANSMPADWETRQLLIGKFGRLHAYAISRLDWIAMKFYAHREVDLEHLSKVTIQKNELNFALTHLRSLLKKLPGDKSQIEMALHIVLDWDTTP